jgi:hypothetical protein
VLEFPRQCSILTQAEVRLTEDHDATSLLHEIAAGRVTSVAVTTAFCKRAAIAQQLVSEIIWARWVVDWRNKRSIASQKLCSRKRSLGPLIVTSTLLEKRKYWALSTVSQLVSR